VLDDAELVAALLGSAAELGFTIDLDPLGVKGRADPVEQLRTVGRVVGDAQECTGSPRYLIEGVHHDVDLHAGGQRHI